MALRLSRRSQGGARGRDAFDGSRQAPGTIVDVAIKPKPRGEAAEHERKWDQVTSQRDLFPKEYRELEFVPITIRLRWHCASTTWLLLPEQSSRYQRPRLGFDRAWTEDAADWGSAKTKLQTISDLETHDFRLFMGNMSAHPQTFVVIGLWYPKRRDQGVLACRAVASRRHLFAGEMLHSPPLYARPRRSDDASMTITAGGVRSRSAPPGVPPRAIRQ